MNIKKIVTTSAAVLMVMGIGASASNVESSPAHASQISRLRTRMNKDYREAHHYNKLGNQIKREINRLNRRHHARRRVTKRSKRSHKSRAYRQGVIDGYSDCGKGRSFNTKRYDHNEQYQNGFIYAMTHNNLHESRKDAKGFFNIYSKYPNKSAHVSDELHF